MMLADAHQAVNNTSFPQVRVYELAQEPTCYATVNFFCQRAPYRRLLPVPDTEYVYDAPSTGP